MDQGKAWMKQGNKDKAKEFMRKMQECEKEMADLKAKYPKLGQG